MSTRESYDAVADEYVERFRNELDHKPFDRERLELFARSVSGVIADVGCGPGQIALYLHSRGAEVRGIDLSAGMVEQARKLAPELEFEVGDMRALPFADASLGGISCFYSIIHVPATEHATVLAEFLRVLAPGGRLLLCFHLPVETGDDTVHLDEWWGRKVDLDFFYFRREGMQSALESAGFLIEEILERDPYPEVEAQTRRAYFVARRPGAGS